MVGPGMGWGERLVRESPDIIIGENQFILYLTDQRLLFKHEKKRKSFAIDRKNLVDVEFFETEAGEPLFVISFRGKKKGRSGDGSEQAIVVFSERSGLPRGDEAEVLFSYLHAIARKNQNFSERRVKKRRKNDNLSPGEHQCSCGNTFQEGTSFCTFCGTKIVLPKKNDMNAFPLFSLGSRKKQVAIPDAPVPPEEEISSVQVPCRVCLEPVPENSLFCKYCGASQVSQKKPGKKPGFGLISLFRPGNNKS